MSEKTIGGNSFQIGQLGAMQELHLARRLTPIIPALLPTLGVFQKLKNSGKLSATGGDETEEEKTARGQAIVAALAAELGNIADVLGPLTNLFSSMPDADVDYIVQTCLSVVKMEQGDRWYNVQGSGEGKPLMFQDLRMDTILPLCKEVIVENLGPFIAGFLQTSPAPAAAQASNS